MIHDLGDRLIVDRGVAELAELGYVVKVKVWDASKDVEWVR